MFTLAELRSLLALLQRSRYEGIGEARAGVLLFEKIHGEIKSAEKTTRESS